MNEQNKIKLAEKVLQYCKEFNVPLNFLFEILSDQKVTPMIRGKAMEYNAYIILEGGLDKSIWSVQKLNLNAQTGFYDEDISITHRKTGIILKVESKSTVRGSFSLGKRSRIIKEPHFNVKSHRSRSNIKLAGTTNDRYSVDTFDVLLTNLSNAIFEGNTISEHLEVLHDAEVKEFLYSFYKVQNDIDLIAKCEADWRFCFPKDIGVDGFIPRTPYVKFSEDSDWKALSVLPERLLEAVEEKRKSTKPTRRK